MSSLNQPPRSMPLQPQIKVLSLNVWGLAHISKARQFRIRHIADRIAQGDWDVVALQEIWVESEDWKALKERCSRRFPHSKFFYSGAFGSGLAILSRFRIVATHTHPYSLNGLPIHVGHGDWFVGKAAGSVTLEVEPGFLVDVYNTHTVAAGGEDGPEKNRSHRIVQAWEMAQLVRNSAERGRHVIALGDFNSTPPSLSVSILRNVAHLSDAFLSTHPGLPPHAISLPENEGRVPDAHRCIAELGVTCDSPINTWTAGKKLDPRARAGAGKRLDYIFFRGPALPGDSVALGGEGRLQAKQCRVTFTDLIPGTQMSYTDHFGIEAAFALLPETKGSRASAVSVNRSTERMLSALDAAVSALGAYVHVSRATQKTHLLGFSGCLTLALGLAVSSPFIGYTGYSFWAAIAIVFATAAGWGGTTLLYSGLVWGEWEKRSIRTVIESMELLEEQIKFPHLGHSDGGQFHDSETVHDRTGGRSAGSPLSEVGETVPLAPGNREGASGHSSLI